MIEGGQVAVVVSLHLLNACRFSEESIPVLSSLIHSPPLGISFAEPSSVYARRFFFLYGASGVKIVKLSSGCVFPRVGVGYVAAAAGSVSTCLHVSSSTSFKRTTLSPSTLFFK